MLNYNRSLYRRRRRAAANQFRDAETLMYYISSAYVYNIIQVYIVHNIIWVRCVLYTYDFIIIIANIPVRNEKKI